MLLPPGKPPILVDFGITSPYAEGKLLRTSKVTGFAAKQYQDRKAALYRKRGASYCDFYPVIHESSGRLCDTGWSLLKSLATLASTGKALSPADFITSSLQRLGIVRIRGIFRMIRAYTPVHARLTGSSLLPGLPVPSVDTDALDGG